MDAFTDSLSKALRYTTDYSHADFHRKLRETASESASEESADRTAHGAYADWLAENGMPATGEAISKGMLSGHGRVWHVRLDRQAGQRPLPSDFHVERLSEDENWSQGDRICLSANDASTTNHYFHWELPMPAGEGLPLLKRMTEEGVTVAPSIEQRLKTETN